MSMLGGFKRLIAGALLCVAAAGGAGAHEMSMAEMQVREVAPGDFVWLWTASGNRPASQELTPQWPAPCRAEAQTVRCGAAGLAGTFAIDGVGQRYSAAIVKIDWLDGGRRVISRTGSQPQVQRHGGAEDARGAGQIAAAYTLLGIEHILTGWDHLAFVIGLLFLVGFERRLLLTITAFTAAHSVTLALSALQLLTLRPAPVEATIALSIMLVAGEALRTRTTLARRWPALVAFLFGLVHGLGFAGALQEIGLPDKHLWLALLTFNGGVELGQLMVVGASWALFLALRHSAAALPARRAALYGIGTLAGYWSCARIVTLLAS